MRNRECSSIESITGSINYNGPSILVRADHSHMPPRTHAYLPGDERGHVQASSLGGSNSSANVVPQAADLNHGAYYAMEQGERNALKSGALVYSDKTAYVSGLAGQRPEAFIVNDAIIFPDGHTEYVHFSFSNESNAEQARWDATVASLPGIYDAPNPDAVRDSMSPEAHEELMAGADNVLVSIEDEYDPTYSTNCISVETQNFDVISDIDSDANSDSDIATSLDSSEANIETAKDCEISADSD